ncbi:hypothetical protein [Roseovarius sp. M141]|uniref:hypothetical protein n=1 Tax=Roseovarius sp. M141 TaxID=2583806 RepID=UPI0020CB9980|nr:hypothetical protein [Roseovarius sp. M141]
MTILIAALIGACLGGFLAYRRKGRPADIAQYAAVFALIITLIWVFALILITRAAS